MHKILFIGDIIGKVGRAAVRRQLPVWKREHEPDLVVANVENLAHGKGVTPQTLADLRPLSVDVYTSGNHAFGKGPLSETAFRETPNLIRPANYPPYLPGASLCRVEKNGASFLVLNLNGTVFFDRLYVGELGNPFLKLDELLSVHGRAGDIIVVDFHAEATSEKVAFGRYADGRVAAVFGTHTHVPTADARILAGGTAYVTDVGMNGPHESVIGAVPDRSLDMFLGRGSFRYEPQETGPAEASAVLVTCDGNRATGIEMLSAIVPEAELS